MSEQTFDLNMWNLRKHEPNVQSWFQSAFQHNLSKLKSFESAQRTANHIPSVNIAHLFACGKPQGGTYASREVLQYLLQNGGRLDIKDAYGWLPINYACFFAFPATVDVLLEAGSPVQNDMLPQPLDSALQSVAQHKNPCAETCARLLLMHGADPKLGLSSDMHWGGVTWLVWALEAQEFEMAEILYAKGLVSLSQKEKQLLLIRGNTEGFVWAEEHGISLLEDISEDYEGYDMVRQARASYQKRMLNEAVRLPLLKTQEKENDDQKGKGKRKI